jgi:hypothetical protein
MNPAITGARRERYLTDGAMLPMKVSAAQW